jgi:hypothetical protein
MGFPFDRKIQSASTLEDFVNGFENFALREVEIKFHNVLYRTTD